MSRRFAAPIALLCTLVLLLAACGDDGGDDAADETTTTVDASDGDETTTTEGEDEETTTTEGGGEGDLSDAAAVLLAADDFCELWVTAEDSSAMALPDLDDEASEENLADSVALVRAFLVRGAQLAPDEISADYALVAESTSGLLDLLEQYEFDFIAMAAAAEGDPELQARFEAMDSAEIEAAIASVEGWVETNC